MKLDHFFSTHAINKSAWMQEFGFCPDVLYRAMKGRNISLKTAKAIVEATEKQVTYEDLANNLE